MNIDRINNYWQLLNLRMVMICCVLWTGLAAMAQNTDKPNNLSKDVSISFKWDKDDIDWEFHDNLQTKQEIERLFSNSIVMNESDSIVLNSSASPEGNYEYNKRLSERRLFTLIDYIKTNYPLLRTDKLRTYSKGADWDGLRMLVESDLDVPYRAALLEMISSNLTPDQKASRLQTIGNGDCYKYMQKHTFSKLRTSTAMLIFYPKRLESIINPDAMPKKVTLPISTPTIKMEVIKPLVIKHDAAEESEYRYTRPFALKTNLLGDVITAFNVELEVPIGKRFSVLVEWTFPWWGALGNQGGVSPVPVYSEKYTLQLISACIEGRYWFTRSDKLDRKARRWGDYNPLNGWFMGVYAGMGIYDFQLDYKGKKGEIKYNVGITAGYAHPIGRAFHMEYSLGIGYLTTEYYNYTGQGGHKIVNVLPDGSYDRRKQSLIGPTKAKVSLVWMPRWRVKNRK